MKSVAIAITVFRNPGRLEDLLRNMQWAGIPDIPVRVFEDPSPYGDRDKITSAYTEVALRMGVDSFLTAPEWGCMQGIIDHAFKNTNEDWLIYVPDDVVFTRGGLWNELAGVLAYGLDFVGGIQAPYWNATDLVSMHVMPSRASMYNGWIPEEVPQNPHWNGPNGMPRKYVNLNGAGFSMSRRLYNEMGGWPKCTWRLDEYAGYMAWKLGMVCITLPGPPRIHYFGGATPLSPEGKDFHTAEAWKEATGALPEETGVETYKIMEKFKSESWLEIVEYYRSHNK